MKKLVLTLLMIAVVLGGCSSLAVLGEETPTFTASDEIVLTMRVMLIAISAHRMRDFMKCYGW